MNRYIFDVDGTLTPSRRRINTPFGIFFLDFCKRNNVYLVTGSDRKKTIEQVGIDIYNAAKRVYNCSGSDVYEGNENVYTSKWDIPAEAKKWLMTECRISDFPLRTGLHIEKRPGMVNFSVVGRNATLGERKMYFKYDSKTGERNRIAKEFKRVFPTIEAVVGGETGIDIFPLGNDKSQIVDDFDPTDVLYFYGDRMDKSGNDYPLKREIINKDLGFAIEVEGWADTWEKLKCV